MALSLGSLTNFSTHTRIAGTGTHTQAHTYAHTASQTAQTAKHAAKQHNKLMMRAANCMGIALEDVPPSGLKGVCEGSCVCVDVCVYLPVC